MDKKKVLIVLKNYDLLKKEASSRGVSLTALINLIVYEFLNKK